MELKEFITETIKQITDGMLDGSAYVQEKSGSSEGVRKQYTKVNFDIAITTTDEDKSNVGGKVSVIQVFHAGASSESANTTSNQSRIQFEIFLNVKTNDVKYPL